VVNLDHRMSGWVCLYYVGVSLVIGVVLGLVIGWGRRR
jgi:ABC-type dipeptide/oligopeptide/nickel transport system permease subunit